MQRARIAPDPLSYALLLAAAIHGAVVLGLGFIPESQKTTEQHRQSLRVVLVRPDPEPSPEVENPELLAQVTQAGSGEAETTTLTEPPRSTPLIKEPAPPTPTPREPPPEPSKKPAKHKLTATQAADKTPARPVPKPKAVQPRPKRPVTAAQLLASRSEEIDRLTAELERKSQAYAKRPRRKAISANTREYKYASYLEAWRHKVERIGNLNYPDEAKRKKLYGNLVLHVSIRPDGSVERIRVLHSSGHKILDDAAVRIVKLAAPFAPFPKDIRAETDILDITRTWQFLNSNRLGWD